MAMQFGIGQPLPSPPVDGISRIRFSKFSELLLASSWDKTLRLYDAAAANPLGLFPHQSPLLDCCFYDDNVAYAGSLDGCVYRTYMQTGVIETVGAHNASVRCLENLVEQGLLASGSWDSTLKLWDPRYAQQNVAMLPLPGRVYAMSSNPIRIVVATSGRHILIYDLRKLAGPEQQRESSLKFQTRCVSCYPNGQGFAISSVEGRVAMEYFDMTPEVQAAKYAFKCHRDKDSLGRERAHPVHAIAFHPGFGTFATGGGDGTICVWDGDNKKRLTQIAQYPSSVASLSFNQDGGVLAVASSYMHEQGEREHPADSIFIRPVQELEVRPKPKK